MGVHDGPERALSGHEYDQTQTQTYRQQLDMGIRFLDIRLRHFVSKKGGINFPVFHSTDYQYSYFDKDSDYSDDPDTTNFVLQDCIAFLDANPSECIVMSIKQECYPVDNKTFEDDFRALIAKNHRDRDYFWLENGVPTLDEARGRIVIANRLQDPDTPTNPSYPNYTPTLGVLWPYWDKGLYQTDGVDVEDHYMDTTTSAKWGKVKDHLDKASGKAGPYGGDADNFWYITFVSCAPGNASPYSWANTMNPLLDGYLNGTVNTPRAKTRLGLVIVDYPPQDVVDGVVAYAENAYPATTLISRWDGSGWDDRHVTHPTRIAVGPNGNPSYIDSHRRVWHYDTTWTQLAGQTATDIAVDPSGHIRIVGDASSRTTGGFKLYSWTGSSWAVALTGGVVRIASGPHGALYGIDNEGNVLQHTGTAWTTLPALPNGTATDLSVGGDGTLWVLGGTAAVTGGHAIQTWNGTGWTAIPGAAVRIAAGPNGRAYIVNDVQEVWAYDGSTWKQMPNVSASDVGVNGADVLWIVGA